MATTLSATVTAVVAVCLLSPALVLASRSLRFQTDPRSSGCSYQGTRYNEGDQVVTPEPCLNCTCKRGVLLCFLKVCPALLHHATGQNCQTIREPGHCCPIVKCEYLPATNSDDWTSAVTTPISTSVSVFQEKQTVGLHVNDLQNQQQQPANHEPSVIKGHSSSSVRLSSEGMVHATTPRFSSYPTSESSINDLDEKGETAKVTVTANAVYFQTSPAASVSVQDSPRVVTSSPVNEAARGDGLNPEMLEGGSAVMSSAFCEYCYCIRGKKMCIRPRCHLSIMGCLPRYSSEYACCPTSYACGASAMSVDSDNNWTKMTAATPVVDDPKDSLPGSATTASKSAITSTTSATTFSTTAASASVTSTAASAAGATRSKSCRENGKFYRLGEQMSSNKTCLNCYCWHGGVKKCKKIQCSPAMNGCTPILPPGHCCPVEYKCNNNNNNKKTSRPRLDEDAELNIANTELPTTTIAESLSSDEIPSPFLPAVDPIKSTAVKQMYTDSSAAETGGDVELSIDEPTTLPSITSTAASTSQPSLAASRENKRPDVTGADAAKAGDDEAKPDASGFSPVFVHVPFSSSLTPTTGHQYEVTTHALIIHAPSLQSEGSVTAERREESVSSNTESSLPTGQLVDLSSPRANESLSTKTHVKNNVTERDSDSDKDLKIQPNQLYANWGNNLRNVSKQESGGDRVETILDGIIQALDTRVNQELPSEPRDTLVAKSAISEDKVTPQVGVKEATSRRADESAQIDHSSPSPSLLLMKENRKDDDEEQSFQLPPIPTGYISNLNPPPSSEYLVHRNQHQQNNFHNGNSNANKDASSYSSSETGLKNFTSGPPPPPQKAHSAHGNTVGRIQVSSKIGFSMMPEQPSLLHIPHLPRPQTHMTNSGGSFLVVGEDNDVKKAGTVEDEPLGTHVEIITAKTPFLEANLSNSNSFLINLSPTTLQVSSPSAGPSFYGLNDPVFDPSKRGSVSPANPATPDKPMPSFPTYFSSSNNQWKIVTQNHSPKSKLPKSDDPNPADAYAPIGPELTRRSGFVIESAEDSDGKDAEASDRPAVAAPPETLLRAEEVAVGQENPMPTEESFPSSHAINRSQPSMSPFLKRNGNIAVRGAMTGTEDQWSESAIIPSSSVQQGSHGGNVLQQQVPASHVTPVFLTATPTSQQSLIPVSHDGHELQPEASALKLTAPEPASPPSDLASEQDAPESKLERSSTDLTGPSFLARYPHVPSSVHSIQYQRPAFPFDPSIPSLPENSFALNTQNAAGAYPAAASGISRSDQTFGNQPGRQPSAADSISPLIPPKPGSFLRTPTNHFLPPNRSGLPQSGMYGRVPQSKISVPWNSFSQSGTRGSPLQNQMIGPVVGPRNPPHLLNPSQPHIKNPFHAKIHFLNPYALSDQKPQGHQQPLLPQHSQLVPSIVAPPDVQSMSHSAPASSHSNGMMSESHVANPSKIYALTPNVKVDVPQTSASPIPSSSLFPGAILSGEKTAGKDGKIPVEASTLLESLMNVVAASSAGDANEVTPSVAHHVTSTSTTPSPITTTSKPIWKLSTKKQLLFSASSPPTTSTSTSTTTVPPSTTTEDTQKGDDRWSMLQVSGCNIYGTFYQVNQGIGELSSACKKCFCSKFGVQCSNVC